MKKCTDCENLLDKTMFNKNKRQGDGLNNTCRSCQSIRNKKRYSVKKKEIRAQHKEYRLKDVAAYNEMQKKQYIKHKEKRLAEAKEAYKKNPEAFKDRAEARDKRIQDAIPSGVDKKIINTLYSRLRAKCRKLRSIHGIKFSRHHIVPLDKGGVHAPCNWTIISNSQNSSINKNIELHNICWLNR